VDIRSWRAALLDEASRPYRKVGPGLFAYFFARGKLGADPVYQAILELGLLRERARILDLGCGQALLAAWLRAAAHLHEQGRWPENWPPAPRPQSIRGIEVMVRDVERARRALGAEFDITHGDIVDVDFGAADAVVVLDVLHYLAPPAQRDILERIRRALPAGGLLLLRVSDARGGLRYHYTRWIDKLVMLARGHPWISPHCRSAAEWQMLLHGTGFDSTSVPMSRGTPFANVLLIAYGR
jgi:SAM-dependent methyltransferase